jgi:uncharacterized damage-inducible protein DinB
LTEPLAPTPWTAPAPEPVDGPTVGPDRPMLEGYLRWQRSVLLNVCAGLNGEQLARRPLATTSLSLLGIVRHLTKVERTWLRIRIAGEDVTPFFDPALGKDHDFEATDPDRAADDVAAYVAEGRAADAAARDRPFDDTCTLPGGEVLSLRMVYVHLIGEYGRHLGHADLLREAIDGVTGR